MMERSNSYEPDPIEGRFQILARHRRRAWIVIVEPDHACEMLVIVTVFENK
jgi:hypothetical protein